MGKHSEIIPCNLSAAVRWALCEETLRDLSYKIIYKDEKELIGMHETNRTKLQALIVTAGVEGKSEGVFSGPPRERVEEFVKLFQLKLKKLTPQEQEALAMIADREVVTVEYVAPPKLPPPSDQERSTPMYAIAAALAITAVTGYAYVIVDRGLDGFNWPLILILAYAFALSYSVRLCAQFGKFYRLNTLAALIIVCSLALGSWTTYYDYSHDLLMMENTGQLIFNMMYRFILPFLIGYGLVRETVRKARKSAVPEEVLRFAIHMHNTNPDEVTLRSALAKKGWHAENDQDKVIQALRAHLQIQEHKKNEALKK